MLLNLIITRSVGGQLILMIPELVSPLNTREFFVFGERTGIIYGTGTPNYNIYYHHQSPRRDTTFQLSQQPMWTQFSIVCDLHLKLACWIFLTVDFGWHERREEMLIILYRSRRQKNLRGTVTCCWMETYKERNGINGELIQSERRWRAMPWRCWRRRNRILSLNQKRIKWYQELVLQ